MSSHTDVAMKVFADVAEERARQDANWGEQNHHPFLYLTVLMEEVGEASKAAVQAHGRPGKRTWADYRTEMVQVAAVALAMIECYDRGEWNE